MDGAVEKCFMKKRRNTDYMGADTWEQIQGRDNMLDEAEWETRRRLQRKPIT